MSGVGASADGLRALKNVSPIGPEQMSVSEASHAEALRALDPDQPRNNARLRHDGWCQVLGLRLPYPYATGSMTRSIFHCKSIQRIRIAP
jgi:hypothetical protein